MVPLSFILQPVCNLHICGGHCDPLQGELLLKVVLRGIFLLPGAILHPTPTCHTQCFAGHSSYPPGVDWALRISL